MFLRRIVCVDLRFWEVVSSYLVCSCDPRVWVGPAGCVRLFSEWSCGLAVVLDPFLLWARREENDRGFGSLFLLWARKRKKRKKDGEKK
jgi:hypothetical protein